VESVWKAVDSENVNFRQFLSYQPFHNLFNTVFPADTRHSAGFPPNEHPYYYYYY